METAERKTKPQTMIVKVVPPSLYKSTRVAGSKIPKTMPEATRKINRRVCVPKSKLGSLPMWHNHFPAPPPGTFGPNDMSIGMKK